MKLQINPTKSLSEYAFHCTAAIDRALYFKLNNRLYILNDPDNPNLETSKISLIDYCINKFTIKSENCQYFHSNFLLELSNFRQFLQKYNKCNMVAYYYVVDFHLFFLLLKNY